MTLQQEAKELVSEFRNIISNTGILYTTPFAKQCALLCVERELNLLFEICGEDVFNWSVSTVNIYQKLEQLKTEIENL